MVSERSYWNQDVKRDCYKIETENKQENISGQQKLKNQERGLKIKLKKLSEAQNQKENNWKIKERKKKKRIL